ncbi:MAG: NAD(P)H-binding protein [Caulobacteraceae bacterium]
MTEHKTALVLGATGGVGGEMARALAARGWTVRAMVRDPARIAQPIAGVEWVRGDAMNRADVVEAAKGADLIVHGVNPPGYRNWGDLAVPMLENTIAAARAAGARIFFPGTVYNFGPDAFPLVPEDAPQAAADPQGRHPGRDGDAPARRLRARRAGADPARRRLLRPPHRQQLVRRGGGEAGRAAEGRGLSRPARCRPRLGVPCRTWRRRPCG